MQRDDALALANWMRERRRDIRRLIHTQGADVLIAILDGREQSFERVPVIDIVRLASPNARVNHARMNATAVRDSVNLMMPLGRASDRTIRWTIEYIREHPLVGGSHALKGRTKC